MLSFTLENVENFVPCRNDAARFSPVFSGVHVSPKHFRKKFRWLFLYTVQALFCSDKSCLHVRKIEQKFVQLKKTTLYWHFWQWRTSIVFLLALHGFVDIHEFSIFPNKGPISRYAHHKNSWYTINIAVMILVMCTWSYICSIPFDPSVIGVRSFSLICIYKQKVRNLYIKSGSNVDDSSFVLTE